MSKKSQIQDRPLRIITSEEELANMQNNRDKLIQKLGRDKYDKMVKQLEEYLKRK